MGDPFTSFIAVAGLAWWQGEQAKEAAQEAEKRQIQAEKRADLIAEAQRQADIAAKRRVENLLPPIVGSQTPESQMGISALEYQEDITVQDIKTDETGVQVGSRSSDEVL